MDKIKTLVFHVEQPNTMSYREDWVDAFYAEPRLQVDLCQIPSGRKQEMWVLDTSEQLKRTIFTYDLIVLLHSVFSGNGKETFCFPPGLIPLLQNRRGKLVTFLLNEYKEFDFKNNFLKKIKCDLVASLLPKDVAEKVYPGFRVESVLHGIHENVFKMEREWKERPIDLGTRSVIYSPVVGDNDRNDLFNFLASQDQQLLKIDVSQDHKKRFSRNDWASFLNRCKATPATAAGSRYIDPEGSFQKKVHSYMERGGVTVPFEKIAEECRAEGHDLICGKTLSGRHFEAMATKTLLVMFPEPHLEMLRPDVHYLSLNRDFSNWKEVCEKIKDLQYAQKITDHCHEWVLQTHTYRHRMNKFMEYLSP